MRGPAGPGASLACIPGRQAPFPWMDAVLWSQVEALVSVPPSPPQHPSSSEGQSCPSVCLCLQQRGGGLAWLSRHPVWCSPCTC